MKRREFLSSMGAAAFASPRRAIPSHRTLLQGPGLRGDTVTAGLKKSGAEVLASDHGVVESDIEPGGTHYGQ